MTAIPNRRKGTHMNVNTFSPELITAFLHDPAAHELHFECGNKRVCLLKAMRDDNNVYLYAVFGMMFGKSIPCVSKDHEINFSSVYNTLHDKLVCGGALNACYVEYNKDAPAEQSFTAYASTITQRIADRAYELIGNKPVPVTEKAEKAYNEVYSDITARSRALDWFYDENLPHEYFPTPDASVIWNYENELLASLDDPDAYVEERAVDYVVKNANKINVCLENYRLVRAEYAKLLLDENGDHYMRKRIAEAVNGSSAKTVTLDLDKDGKQLSVKIEANAMTYLNTAYYSTYKLDAPSRRRFEAEFGSRADIFAKDITRITYAKNVIYERKESYIDHTEDGAPIVTLSPDDFEHYMDEGIIAPVE